MEKYPTWRKGMEQKSVIEQFNTTHTQLIEISLLNCEISSAKSISAICMDSEESMKRHLILQQKMLILQD